MLMDSLADEVMDKLIEGRTLPAEDRNKRHGSCDMFRTEGVEAGWASRCVRDCNTFCLSFP